MGVEKVHILSYEKISEIQYPNFLLTGSVLESGSWPPQWVLTYFWGRDCEDVSPPCLSVWGLVFGFPQPFWPLISPSAYLSIETSSSQVQELLKYCCEQEDGFFSTKHDTSGRSTYSLASQILPTIRKLKKLHSLMTNSRPPLDHYPSNWPIG